jgi:hypothetical protein
LRSFDSEDPKAIACMQPLLKLKNWPRFCLGDFVAYFASSSVKNIY